MDIRSSLDGLKSLLGAISPPAAAPQPRTNTVASGMTSDRATFSSAGSEVSLTASDSGVRADKVASVQASLAAGTYSVSAADVASKLVDSMLGASH